MLRNPNTIPADDTLIEDPIMEPFFITKSNQSEKKFKKGRNYFP